MKQWDIYLHDEHFDTVFFNEDCDLSYVKNSLINHDGYSPNITILEA